MAVITISRQYGAGGKTIGEMVALKLDYSLFDNELIQLVAEKAKVSAEGIELLEQRSWGKFQTFISGMVPKSIVNLVRGKKEVTLEEVYVDVLHEIISRIAEEGNVIIIGRGGQYILKDKANVFHVLATADREDRKKFLVKKYGLSPIHAEKAITIDDRRRENLYRKFGKDDYNNPVTYHMVLNTSKIDLATASGLICDMVNF
ncbi:AAA family ATPase [Thermodesulfobacteriota bacterium]